LARRSRRRNRKAGLHIKDERYAEDEDGESVDTEGSSITVSVQQCGQDEGKMRPP
jgi:hypothetical protein